MSLPIDELLPQLVATLTKHPSVVVQAPPGAGTTTRVPLALLPYIHVGRLAVT